MVYLGVEMEIRIRFGALKYKARSKNTYFYGVDTELRDLGVGRIMEED